MAEKPKLLHVENDPSTLAAEIMKVLAGRNMFLVSVAILAVVKTVKESDPDAWRAALELVKMAEENGHAKSK